MEQALKQYDALERRLEVIKHRKTNRGAIRMESQVEQEKMRVLLWNNPGLGEAFDEREDGEEREELSTERKAKYAEAKEVRLKGEATNAKIKQATRDVVNARRRKARAIKAAQQTS